MPSQEGSLLLTRPSPQQPAVGLHACTQRTQPRAAVSMMGHLSVSASVRQGPRARSALVPYNFLTDHLTGPHPSLPLAVPKPLLLSLWNFIAESSLLGSGLQTYKVAGRVWSLGGWLLQRTIHYCEKAKTAAHFQKIPVTQGFLFSTQQSPEKAMWLPSSPLNR